MNIESVEPFLTTRGWTITDIQESSAAKLPKVTFGYQISKSNSKLAKAWITYYHDEKDPISNAIEIKVFDTKIYSALLSRTSANGYKIAKTYLNSGRLTKIYRSSHTTCVVTVIPQSKRADNMPLYAFSFTGNFIYDNYLKKLNNE